MSTDSTAIAPTAEFSGGKAELEDNGRSLVLTISTVEQGVAFLRENYRAILTDDGTALDEYGDCHLGKFPRSRETAAGPVSFACWCSGPTVESYSECTVLNIHIVFRNDPFPPPLLPCSL
jgi:hypothetical protein